MRATNAPNHGPDLPILHTPPAPNHPKKQHGLHWEADANRECSWFGEELDATGHALAAFSRVSPGDARVEEIVRWLAGRRTGTSWRSTLETAPIATGLLDYAAARPGAAASPGRERAEWNGETVLDRDLAGADPFAARPERVSISGASLKPGENVGWGRDDSLYARIDGVVRKTRREYEIVAAGMQAR